MRKSDLIDRLQEIEGDPEVWIEYPGDTRRVGNVYVDNDGDIIIEE